MRTVVSSIGFDEKFLVRALARWSRDRPKFLVFYPITDPGQSELDSRALKAFNTFKSFADQLEVKVEKVGVNVSDFTEMMVSVARKVKDEDENDLVLELTSGMRIMNYAIMLAVTVLLGKSPVIVVESEDSRTVYQFRPRDFEVPKNLDLVDRMIILAIGSGKDKITEVSEATGNVVSTTWRRVERMRKEGLIDKERLSLTQRGRVLYMVWSVLERDEGKDGDLSQNLKG